jgi:hypothetical protein
VTWPRTDGPVRRLIERDVEGCGDADAAGYLAARQCADRRAVARQRYNVARGSQVRRQSTNKFGEAVDPNANSRRLWRAAKMGGKRTFPWFIVAAGSRTARSGL